MSRFQSEISPQDRNMVLRLVGYWEYANALANLDRMLADISEVERDQLDEYVRRRDEFSVVTALSKNLERDNSSLSSASEGNQERRGLDWVLALARVELGSMLAAFTDTPRPFDVVNPTEFDMRAYKSLLLDGARTHYWALRNDPQLGMVARSSNVTTILSYSRRLVMARAMLRAAMRSGIGDYSPIQQQELASWKQSLDGVQGQLMRRIRAYVQAAGTVNTRTNTTTRSGILSAFCSQIGRAEQREVANGSAEVTTYP